VISAIAGTRVAISYRGPMEANRTRPRKQRASLIRMDEGAEELLVVNEEGWPIVVQARSNQEGGTEIDKEILGVVSLNEDS
jgi:hypothetical protein